MAKKNNNINSEDIKYIKLAYEQAVINIGSTQKNPSVGCVIVNNNSVISSGRTSYNGRPHAEANALKEKINFKGSDLYVTLEPCSHYGKTPPCIKKIINKKIKRVIFSINDTDKRSKNLAYKKLKKNKINVKTFLNKKFAKNFYQSYFLQFTNSFPFIDAKLAVSKDYFTIHKKKQWITNVNSRNVGNFLRSKYDCIVSTAKTVNVDNSMLDCRIEGLEKKSPTVVIIDRTFKIKTNLKMFKDKSRKFLILTQNSKNFKEKYFKKIGVNVIKFKKFNFSLDEKYNIFLYLKKLGFNRILVECGVEFTNEILKNNLVKNFYLFKSYFKLKKNGKNNSNLHLIRSLNLRYKNKVKINLNGDSLYKVQL